MQGLSTASVEKGYLPARKKQTKPQNRKHKRGRSPKPNVLTGPGPFPECLEFPRALSLNAFQTGFPPARLLCPCLGRGGVRGSQPRRGVPAKVCPTRPTAPGCSRDLQPRLEWTWDWDGSMAVGSTAYCSCSAHRSI